MEKRGPGKTKVAQIDRLIEPCFSYEQVFKAHIVLGTDKRGADLLCLREKHFLAWRPQKEVYCVLEQKEPVQYKGQ